MINAQSKKERNEQASTQNKIYKYSFKKHCFLWLRKKEKIRPMWDRTHDPGIKSPMS